MVSVSRDDVLQHRIVIERWVPKILVTLGGQAMIVIWDALLCMDLGLDGVDGVVSLTDDPELSTTMLDVQFECRIIQRSCERNR